MKSIRKKNAKILGILLIVCIAIGYAALNTNLKIDGVVNMPTASWDVHFQNVQISSGSVALSTGDTAATIVPGQTNKVSYKVSLHNPGDYYEFTVDAVNSGTIDAMIDTVSSKLNNAEITNSNLPAYLNYSVTYVDGVPIGEKHKLEAGHTEKYMVRVEYKRDINASDLPQGETLNLNFQVDYIQADSTAIDKPIPSFDDASWDTILIAYNSGNTEWLEEAMESGTTREIQLDMDNDGTAEKTAHLRIANLSTPAECSTPGFSQTACGLVIEFADIVTTRRMNPYIDGNTNGDGNKGGWEYSEMRTYVNTDIYNALPQELRDKIINTSVVSGHGSRDENNFETTDKLYILSTREVYGDSITTQYNTAREYERQLDYYRVKGVTTASGTYSPVIKTYMDSTAGVWWLRTVSPGNYYNIFFVSDAGEWIAHYSSIIRGVSPAFRIG